MIADVKILDYDPYVFARVVQSDDRIKIYPCLFIPEHKEWIQTIKQSVDWMSVHNDRMDVVNRGVGILITGFNEKIKGHLYCSDIVCYPYQTEERTGLILTAFIEQTNKV